VYVFAGIDVHSKRYFNSIERLDTSYNTDAPGKWEVIQDLAPQFTIRQGQCSHQVNKNEIVVFGGFGGDFLDDVFTFNHSEGTMRREERDAPQKIFTYQMPTLYDEVKKHVLTVDWKTKKTLLYQEDKTWTALRQLDQ